MMVQASKRTHVAVRQEFDRAQFRGYHLIEVIPPCFLLDHREGHRVSSSPGVFVLQGTFVERSSHPTLRILANNGFFNGRTGDTQVSVKVLF